jgi:hypothetical protein
MYIMQKKKNLIPPTNLKPLISSLVIGLLTISAACASEHAEAGLPCPCSDGFVCCEAANVCMPQGNACPVTPDINMPKSTDLPCARIEHTYYVNPIETKKETYYYNNLGQEVKFDIDSDIDGTVDGAGETQYDENGHYTLYRTSVDGRIEYQENVVYDALGRKLQDTIHFEFSPGKISDWISVFSYDGLLVHSISQRIDQGFVSRIDTNETQDQRGRPIFRSEDTNMDGVADREEIITYQVRANNGITEIQSRTISKHLATGTVRTFDLSKQINSAGKEIGSTFFANGGLNSHSEITWDEKDRLSTFTSYEDFQSPNTKVYDYEYLYCD